MIEDLPLERNRRAAWARFYEARRNLEAEQLRNVELAVWIERLDPPSDHPVWAEVERALGGARDAFALDGVRRYVDFRCSA